MPSKTEYQKFLEQKGIDNFEYEKIVPVAEKWNALMREWELYKEKRGIEK